MSKIPSINNLNIVDVLDCIYDRIGIADKNGYMIWGNKAFERYNFTRDKLIGKHMTELVKGGLMERSLVLECLATNSINGMGMLQNGKEGGEHLNWVMPHLDEDGKIDYLVSTEWDMHNLTNMQMFFEQTRSLSAKEVAELNYYRSKNNRGVGIIAESPIMKKILVTADHAAHSEANILITGESGTGKEVLTRYIHNRSFRSNAPLIEINCGAIPDSLIESELFGYEPGAFTGADTKGKKGLFELANNGTLFLDEIGELPYNVQSVLLRALENQEILHIGGTKPIPINTRIIAATNINIEDAIKEKSFRKDLYYRLNVIPIELPPLRERYGDVEKLLEYFINVYSLKYKRTLKISSEGIRLMKDYSWPGNIRELQNLVERLFIVEHEDEISTKILSQYLCVENQEAILDRQGLTNENTQGFDLNRALENYEKTILREKAQNFHSIGPFAKYLDMSKSTLFRKLSKYNIKMK